MEADTSFLQVVIFSRNRHVQLIESLRYWHIVGIKTLVLHNTEVPLESINVPESTKYIVHRGSFAERCEIASRHLDSKNYVIASDDERFLPSALAKMVKLLDDSPQLKSVGGQAIAIMKYGWRYKTSLAYSSQISYLNIKQDKKERFKDHYESGLSFGGAMYRVFRKEDFQKFLILISRFTFVSTPYIFEVTSEFYWTQIGSSRYIDEVFWIRNWVVPPVQTNDWDRKLYFYEWYENPQYKMEVDEWKNLMRKELNAQVEDDWEFDTLALLRKNVEMSEIKRTQILDRNELKSHKPIMRKINSIFNSKFELNGLIKQLHSKRVEVNIEELKTALTSLAG